jgi:hypothetical protein
MQDTTTPDTIELVGIDPLHDFELQCASVHHAPGPDDDAAHEGPARFMALVGCGRCGHPESWLALCEGIVQALLADLADDRGLVCSGPVCKSDGYTRVDAIYRRFVSIDTMQTVWHGRTT